MTRQRLERVPLRPEPHRRRSLHENVLIQTRQTTDQKQSLPPFHDPARVTPRANGEPLLVGGGVNHDAPAVSCTPAGLFPRSEEHTSELQSRENLVCRL